MIKHLIDSLLEYKSRMSYKGIDLDGDKPMQYKELRSLMANIYEQDVSLFGPVSIVPLPDDFDELPKDKQASAKDRVKESKELVVKGTKRVMEKVKESRQNFSKAMLASKRSFRGHPGRRDENYHMNTGNITSRLPGHPGYRDHMNRT